MPVRCPLCEMDNHDDAAECATCGRALHVDLGLVEVAPLLDGLEQTVLDPLDSGADLVAALPDREGTALVEGELAVPIEALPVEGTALREDPSAPMNWTGEVDVDRGRETDDGVRTALPEDSGTCPWCGAPCDTAVCDHCGRRRARYTAPRAQGGQRRSRDGETTLCPSCFARVAAGVRCSDCGVPFPLTDLEP